ncbi:hypothetical protein [Devosia chinhatensis]|uniref:Tail protein n=1 Tax=Devosia chinhatensis TaxID=429727 RepID=A0A0F5FQ44_9HYPH|nr:hypothetical protein [Devosia chinhatensis]KKB10297.1 hypothetical protein VE26_05580 [Devosia chinhatensis]
MSQSFPVAGRKIYMHAVVLVPPVSGLLDAADFPDIDDADWGGIGKWQTMGNLGGDQATITSSYLNEEYDDVQMGTKNPGVMSNTFGVVPADAGQIALYAAAGDKALRAFLVEFPDAPTGASAHGTIRLFAAYVKEPVEQGGEANTMGMMTVELVKFKNTVRVAAAATGGPVGGA